MLYPYTFVSLKIPLLQVNPDPLEIKVQQVPQARRVFKEQQVMQVEWEVKGRLGILVSLGWLVLQAILDHLEIPDFLGFLEPLAIQEVKVREEKSDLLEPRASQVIQVPQETLDLPVSKVFKDLQESLDLKV